ncbi:cation:proton antiporter [Granulicella cerasi]|uniref:Cation:proton antiporter n=1 Tax=Granulicella cerasi TaxID=741063 RepID=A0ABW1ZAC1_9BACT|nr:cation:proton antiporter [Granulicella cerasi]
MAVILVVTMLFGKLANRFGQSRVIGEIIGGIVLGPSVLGHLFPGLAAALFPAVSLHALEILSNIGLVLYLFLVGLELDTKHLRQQKGVAFATSLTSILMPFLAAVLLAHPLKTRFAPPTVHRWPFILFLGIAMSITAFPVLARILDERKLTTTPLGTTAILCAAFDDVVAWMLLAVTLTLMNTKQTGTPLWVRFASLIAYLVFMFAIVRPLCGWIVKRMKKRELTYEIFVLAIACLLLSSALTDWAGVHPLFGAFVAGVCFPRLKEWQTATREKIEMLTSALLLPLFFAITGLKTRLDLLNSWNTWSWALLILAAAIGGKIGGAVLAARWSGEDWRSSLGLGALLNTRGLVELVVLNIAYNAGAFSPTLFTMLVLMALITTMCTTPLLNLLHIGVRHGSSEAAVEADSVAGAPA